MAMDIGERECSPRVLQVGQDDGETSFGNLEESRMAVILVVLYILSSTKGSRDQTSGGQSLGLSVTHIGVARYDSKWVAKVLWESAPDLLVILNEMSHKHWLPTFGAHTQVEAESGEWNDDSASSLANVWRREVCVSVRIGQSSVATGSKKSHKRKKAAGPSQPMKRQTSARLTGTKRTATSSSMKPEMVDFFAEDPYASQHKEVLESVDGDAASSTEQHLSSPQQRQPDSRTSQRSAKQTVVTPAIPTIEELQKRLFHKMEETTAEVKTSGKAKQSVGAALRELQGLSKISAEKIHAMYHQSLNWALETIKGSDLPEPIKVTVALFLANFEQRKISCEICVKHVEDYNHAAMAHLEAEKTAKTLVEHAAAAAAQARELAAKQVALEADLKNVWEQRQEADLLYQKMAQQCADAITMRDERAQDTKEKSFHYEHAQLIIAEATKM
ncbi:OLC1v1015550C1 [Oldenlandia corymbosa var. corymbosa]|uniref:OLC1v1015550C1 n=1 Tax=Oldenlandia corymbosa var. corymbosa TaxID=529605 RepID=A0AAV1E5V3_OLDCO|nr:OLC1v1015550C1 [Oldenlandia corymbosa var. corymbosa]